MEYLITNKRLDNSKKIENSSGTEIPHTPVPGIINIHHRQPPKEAKIIAFPNLLTDQAGHIHHE